MAFNDQGQPLCHFCKEVVFEDELGDFYQWGSGWIRQRGWTTTSNHARDVRWTDQYAHHSCLDKWLDTKRTAGIEEGL